MSATDAHPRFDARLFISALALVVLAAATILILGADPSPTAVTPTSPPPSAPSPAPATASPLASQPPLPALKDTNWVLTSIDGLEVQDEAWLGFGNRSATGEVGTMCSTTIFDYRYGAAGASITLLETDHIAEACSAADTARNDRMLAAFPRVTAWRLPVAGGLELLDAAGTVLFAGVPPPPEPTAPPGGDCGQFDATTCNAAAAAAFNHGLFADPGQRVVSWAIAPTKTTVCDGTDAIAKWIVTFQLENPAGEISVWVADFNGHTYICTY
jgi:hypothetical protein